MDILFDENKTRTYKFLFPTLYENTKSFKQLHQSTNNCYLDGDEIVCLRNNNTISSHRIDDVHKEDINKFLQGKYSKLSGMLKCKILKTHNQDENSFIFSTLFKTKKIKEWCKNEYGNLVNSFTIDSEYYFKPNLNTEIYNNKMNKDKAFIQKINILANEILQTLELDLKKQWEEYDTEELNTTLTDAYKLTEESIFSEKLIEFAKTFNDSKSKDIESWIANLEYTRNDRIYKYISETRDSGFKLLKLKTNIEWGMSRGRMENTIQSFLLSLNTFNRQDIFDTNYSIIKDELIRLYN
jgi:hypothetical protein